jgi:hypothetical protein
LTRQEQESLETLKRAGTRAAYHLMRAGVESLKAIEAVLDELGRARREANHDDADDVIRQRIDLE